MTEELGKYISADIIIEEAKFRLGIEGPNSVLANEEIALIMRFLASGAQDTVWTDEGPIYRRIGIGMMLSLTLYVFPEHYVKYELSQAN